MFDPQSLNEAAEASSHVTNVSSSRCRLMFTFITLRFFIETDDSRLLTIFDLQSSSGKSEMVRWEVFAKRVSSESSNNI